MRLQKTSDLMPTVSCLFPFIPNLIQARFQRRFPFFRVNISRRIELVMASSVRV